MAAKKSDKLNPRADATGILRGLAIQFILGMLVNLFGEAPDASGHMREPIWMTLIFILHGLIGIGLVIGAVVIYFRSKKAQDTVWEKVALQGMVAIIVAGLGGLATVALREGTGAELASLVMSLGFIGAFILYGRYFLLK